MDTKTEKVVKKIQTDEEVKESGKTCSSPHKEKGFSRFFRH